MTNKPHKHTDVLRAIADGVPLSEFEVWYKFWETKDFQPLVNYWLWVEEPELWEIRRKQRTHVVNGFTVPAPMDKEPSKDVFYFMTSPYASEYYAKSSWTGLQCEKLWLKRGIVHATKEAAVANAKAMLKIDPSKE